MTTTPSYLENNSKRLPKDYPLGGVDFLLVATCGSGGTQIAFLPGSLLSPACWVKYWVRNSICQLTTTRLCRLEIANKRVEWRRAQKGSRISRKSTSLLNAEHVCTVISAWAEVFQSFNVYTYLYIHINIITLISQSKHSFMGNLLAAVPRKPHSVQ